MWMVKRGAWCWIAAVLLLGAVLGCGRDPEAYNVVLVSLDTLRADRLGCYGYDRGISPTIDRLAQEGVLFSQAISHSPWTTPSHMSLFSSQLPSEHGVNQDWRRFMLRDDDEGYRVLGSGTRTLPEVLQGAGYTTLALTGGGTVDDALGFGRGFDVYNESAAKLKPQNWTTLMDWLDQTAASPFFLFLHTFEVHAPYRHVSDAREYLGHERADALESFIEENPSLTEAEMKRYLVEAGLFDVEVTSRLYDGGVRFADRFVGQLLDELRRRDLYDETLVVLVSDHGEEFADHRPQKIYNVHCDSLYEELVRVPFILRAPGRFEDGRRVDQQVRLIDVAPTILDLVGLEVPSTMRGVSLTSLMEGQEVDELAAIGEASCIGPELKSIRESGFKYMASLGEPPDGERSGFFGEPAWERLYRLDVDPLERQDLLTVERTRASRMREALQRRLSADAATTAGETIPVEEELSDQLRALGYVD